jgi:hypothetical protein
MHPDSTCGLIRAERRPINAFELADLETMRLNAMAEQRSARRRTFRTLAAGGAVYSAMWAAVLLTGHEGFVASTVAVAAGVSTWGLRRKRRRNDWVKRVAEAKAHPVEQIDIAPLRAWRCGTGWIFDLGGGVGMFAQFEIPGGTPRSLLTWRKAMGFAAWIDQSGAAIACGTVSVLSLPANHPLCERVSPVVFALDSKKPVESILRFEGGHFAL